jgi:hypothetical protein
MKKKLLPLLAVLATTAVGGSAQAQLINISVPDGSFESPAGTSSSSPFDTTPGNDTAEALIPGWTAAMSDPNNSNSYGVVSNSTLSSAGTSDQSQSAFMQVYFNGTTSTLTSNSLGNIAASTTYTLTVAIGAPTTPSSLDNVSGTSGETAAQADISLLADGNVASEFTLVNSSVPVGTEADYTTTFTTGASGGFIGDALTIQLEADKAFYTVGSNTFVDPGDESIMFDNVRLTETPEPSTWALMLGGAGFLVLLARRNFRRV